MNISVTNTDSSPNEAPAGESNLTLVVYVVVALAVAFFVRTFIATPYVVSGSSMENTFHNLDYLIVDRLSYHFSPPERGDVIVFDLPQDPSRALIKRVIGLPGETVVLEGPQPHVRIINSRNTDGFVLAEPYIESANFGGLSNQTITLGDDQYFVMGDHRSVSSDSRSWGALPKNDIVGRAIVRLFPFTQIGIEPGVARYQSSQ